jgi:hypothetical protein
MKTEPHPIELALLAGLVTLQAAAVVVVALVVLVLSLASWRPTAPAPAPPLQHPLAVIAAELQALPHRELMQLAGTRRRLAKHRLAGLVLSHCL